MAVKSKSTSKTSNPEATDEPIDPQADHVPEVEDDVDPEPAAVAAADDETGDQRRHPDPEPAPQDEDARSRATRLYREKRDREIADQKALEREQAADRTSEDTDDVDTGDDGESLEADADTQKRAVKQNREPEADADEGEQDPEVELKIYGRTVKKRLSEVISLAQVGAAGDARLEEASRILREAQALRSQPPENPPAPTDKETREPDGSQAGPKSENPPAAGIDQEKLKRIAERIQIGDEEEGASALTELTELVREVVTNAGSNAQANADEIGNIVQNSLFQTDTKREIESALGRFAEHYPVLAEDKDLAEVGKTVLRRELIADLKSVGLDDQDLQPLQHNVTELARLQRQLRLGGHKVRTYEQVLDSVGGYMSDKFGIERVQTSGSKPAPGSPQRQPQRPAADPAQVQDRIERKRAAPKQPRPAGVRGQVQQPQRPKTRRDFILEEKARRGFKVTT